MRNVHRLRGYALVAAAAVALQALAAVPLSIVAAMPALSSQAARAAAPTARAAAAGPCGTARSPGRYKHVIWVWMENHSYGTIIGSKQAPYINRLAADCRVATIVVSPGTPRGTRSARLFSHYSLLATAEQLLHLRRLGLAATAATMTTAFRL